MAYKSLYLKYRPQRFSEVAGQRPIIQTLQNSLKAGKIAHAYLFTGPRGTGKTTMARLFAKALDCEEGIGNQCCQCSNCIAIAEGSHPDVIEIDAASNNGVDQVRELIDKVKYAPIKGKYKIYIIDEVHMMTPGAFNALLKTLEEPPENVIFILCTTEPHKVLPTILSRCQRFDFGKISEEDMRKKLTEVLKEEKANYDEEGLSAVISLAEGGMRDCFSITDQVLAYSGNTLFEKDVLALYGLASLEEKITLLKEAYNGDVASIMRRVSSYSYSGIDIRRLTSDLIAILKDYLVYSKTKDETLLVRLTLDGEKDLETAIPSNRILPLLEKFIQTQNSYKNVNDVRSLFEVTLLEISATKEEAAIPSSKAISEFAKAKETKVVETAPIIKNEPEPAVIKEEIKEKPLEKSISSETSKVESPKLTLEEPPSFLFDDEDAKTEEPPLINKNKIPVSSLALEGDTYALSDEEIINILVLGNKKERTELAAKWGEFEKLRDDDEIGPYASLLSNAHPWCLCNEILIITVDFTKQKVKANIKANQETFEKLVEELLGRKVFVYALDPVERSRIIGSFYSLQQVGKLPNKGSIEIHLPK